MARKFESEEVPESSPRSLAAVVTSADPAISHNLNGQKLGRKGRITRERILTATVELLADSEDKPISLSAVARRASLGMTAIYNYFADLTELLLAVLEPVMATNEEAFLGMLRAHWSDAELSERCDEFLHGYHDFWSRHARLLHLRNAMSDNRDERMMIHRVRSTLPVIGLLAQQMGGSPEERDTPAYTMATVLMTGIERTITVATDKRLTEVFGPRHNVVPQLKSESRLMELAIRDMRHSDLNRG